MTYCHSLDALCFYFSLLPFFKAYSLSLSLLNNNRGPTVLVFFCAILDATQMVVELG